MYGEGLLKRIDYKLANMLKPQYNIIVNIHMYIYYGVHYAILYTVLVTPMVYTIIICMCGLHNNFVITCVVLQTQTCT